MQRKQQSQQAQGETDKVRFMAHFPHTFLKAYGRCYPLQTKQKFLYHLKPTNCEWLQRPKVAISEFAETITENLPVLERYRGFLVHDEYLDQLNDFYEPIMENLNNLNSKNDGAGPGEDDVAYFLQAMVSRDDDLDVSLDAMYEASASLYLMAIHTKTVRQLLRNVKGYASKIPVGVKDAHSFQQAPTVRSMQEYLTTSIIQNVPAAQEDEDIAAQAFIPHCHSWTTQQTTVFLLIIKNCCTLKCTSSKHGGHDEHDAAVHEDHVWAGVCGTTTTAW